MSFINRKYKDSVFTDLFGSDRDGKKNFLELYNGLSGSDYRLEEVTLERKIIEQSLYKTYNNDVSWEIDGKLIVLVEQQELRLSDAFYKKGSSSLELIVKVRNCTNFQGAHLKRQSTQRFPKASCLTTWIENRGR